MTSLVKEWACPMCTLLNDGRRHVCLLCHAAAPPEIPSLQSDEKLPVFMSPLLIQRDEKYSSVNKNNQRTENCGWPCSRCTYSNAANMANCDMCFAVRPSTSIIDRGPPSAAAASVTQMQASSSLSMPIVITENIINIDGRDFDWFQHQDHGPGWILLQDPPYVDDFHEVIVNGKHNDPNTQSILPQTQSNGQHSVQMSKSHDVLSSAETQSNGQHPVQKSKSHDVLSPAETHHSAQMSKSEHARSDDGTKSNVTHQDNHARHKNQKVNSESSPPKQSTPLSTLTSPIIDRDQSLLLACRDRMPVAYQRQWGYSRGACVKWKNQTYVAIATSTFNEPPDEYPASWKRDILS